MVALVNVALLAIKLSNMAESAAKIFPVMFVTVVEASVEDPVAYKF